jgi:hypothetical protein
MIVTEYYRTREDGVVLNLTYSNIGMMIERDGVRYSEAIDPADLNREYIETDVPIEVEELEHLSELEQKAKAYDILMGVSE